MSYVNPGNIKVEQVWTATGVPQDVYREFVGKLPDGRYFTFLRPRENWTYENWTLVIDFQAVRIDKVVRYRDGGTTEIETEIGKFNFPTPFDEALKPTWEGQEITVYERV